MAPDAMVDEVRHIALPAWAVVSDKRRAHIARVTALLDRWAWLVAHPSFDAIRAALGVPTPDRILKISQAMRLGANDELIHNACRVDPWFLAEIRAIVDSTRQVGELLAAISSGAREQAQGISQVGTAIQELDQMTQQNAALVEQSAAAAASLKDQAQRLTESMSTFRI